MAQAYLFVHFREKTTPDGEQVYFGKRIPGGHKDIRFNQNYVVSL